jgi:probable rRNA maturation factor
VCSDEQTDVDIDAARWSSLAKDVLRAEGANGELTLTFVDRAEIAALNAEHMGVDGPTDVLSFPLDAVEAGTARHDSAPPVLLGDVVVCPAIAVAGAFDHGADADDELALLVVHGVLHVLGHDHAEPEETASMRERERALLSEFHWHGPAPATFRHGSVPTMLRHGPAPATFRHGSAPTMLRREQADP